uniref:EGF-like domain-containing protein n=1 Tax=Macrostomum lignano TaxID=282301 RepID=A0A1I8HU64_9PLAT
PLAVETQLHQQQLSVVAGLVYPLGSSHDFALIDGALLRRPLCSWKRGFLVVGTSLLLAGRLDKLAPLADMAAQTARISSSSQSLMLSPAAACEAMFADDNRPAMQLPGEEPAGWWAGGFIALPIPALRPSCCVDRATTRLTAPPLLTLRGPSPFLRRKRYKKPAGLETELPLLLFCSSGASRACSRRQQRRGGRAAELQLSQLLDQLSHGQHGPAQVQQQVVQPGHHGLSVVAAADVVGFCPGVVVQEVHSQHQAATADNTNSNTNHNTNLKIYKNSHKKGGLPHLVPAVRELLNGFLLRQHHVVPRGLQAGKNSVQGLEGPRRLGLAADLAGLLDAELGGLEGAAAADELRIWQICGRLRGRCNCQGPTLVAGVREFLHSSLTAAPTRLPGRGKGEASRTVRDPQQRPLVGTAFGYAAAVELLEGALDADVLRREGEATEFAGVLHIRLDYYRQKDQNHCDQGLLVIKDLCDPYFIVTAGPIGRRALTSFESKPVDNAHRVLQFGNKIGQLSNPLRFWFKDSDELGDLLDIKVTVKDHDPLTPDELIEQFRWTLPLANLTTGVLDSRFILQRNAAELRALLTGALARGDQLSLHAWVSCRPGRAGPACRVACTPVGRPRRAASAATWQPASASACPASSTPTPAARAATPAPTPRRLASTAAYARPATPVTDRSAAARRPRRAPLPDRPAALRRRRRPHLHARRVRRSAGGGLGRRPVRVRYRVSGRPLRPRHRRVPPGVALPARFNVRQHPRGFECRCQPGFSGRLCQLPPMLLPPPQPKPSAGSATMLTAVLLSVIAVLALALLFVLLLLLRRRRRADDSPRFAAVFTRRPAGKVRDGGSESQSCYDSIEDLPLQQAGENPYEPDYGDNFPNAAYAVETAPPLPQARQSPPPPPPPRLSATQPTSCCGDSPAEDSQSNCYV